MNPRLIISRAFGPINKVLSLTKKQITIKSKIIHFLGEKESTKIEKNILNELSFKGFSCEKYQSKTRKKSKILIYSFVK